MYAVCACVNVSVFVEAGWAGAAEICLHALSRNDAKVLGSSNLSIKLLVNINILYIYRCDPTYNVWESNHEMVLIHSYVYRLRRPSDTSQSGKRIASLVYNIHQRGCEVQTHVNCASLVYNNRSCGGKSTDWVNRSLCPT